MTTSFIPVTPGDGTKKAATHSIAEDAVVKELQRIVENTPAGVDKSFGAGAADAGTIRNVHATDDPLLALWQSLTAADTVPTFDSGPNWTTIFGLSGARFTSANASAADAAVTPAPTSGQKMVITDVYISVDTAMRVDLKEETSGTVFFSKYMAANSSDVVVPRGKFKLLIADKRLMVRTSVAGNIAVTALGYSEA